MTLSLDPILNSSRFPHLLRELNLYAKKEQQKREEFYDWITEDSRAEFINGEVVVQSPAKDQHTSASTYLSALIGAYVDVHEIGMVRAETALISLTRNDYLPDICFFNQEKSKTIGRHQMKYPAPDMVVEILSPSTERTDRDQKMVDYADHDVQEYWLVDPERESVEIYLLETDAFVLSLKVNDGVIESNVISGFSIPVRAIFDRKIKNSALLAILSAE